MRLIKLCTIVAMTAAFAGRAEESPNGNVGSAGEARRLKIIGLKTFAEQAVWCGLMADIDVHVAAHPTAPMAKYLDVLEQKVTLGLHHAGFADPMVTARHDDGRDGITLTISEGPRFQNGSVRILGAHDLNTDALIQRLTTPQSKSTANESRPLTPDDLRKSFESTEDDKPQTGWKPGEPTHFDQLSRDRLRLMVLNALADQGSLSPAFDVMLKRDDATGRADLVVAIKDAGRHRRIQHIVVTGNKRQSRQQILTFLGLQSGMAIDRNVIAQIQDRLRSSARFFDYKVTPQISRADHTRIDLHIEVAECDSCALLAEELSRDDQVLLKYAERLSQFGSGPDELVLEATREKGQKVQMVVAPGRGIVVRSVIDPGTETIARHALVLSNQRSAVYSLSRNRALIGSHPVSMPKLSIAIDPKFDRNKDRWMSLIKINSGIRWAEKSGTFCAVHFAVAPVALVWKRNGEARSVANGVLTVTWDDRRLQIDETTGRLLGFEWGRPNNGWRVVGRLETGSFDAMLEEIDEISAECINDFDPHRTNASILAYALNEGFWWSQTFGRVSQEQASVAQKDLKERIEQVRQIIEHLVARMPPTKPKGEDQEKSATESFIIPASPARSEAAHYASIALVLGANWLNNDRWPWRLLRESVCVACGETDYTIGELEDLCTPGQMGPIGFLTMAAVANYVQPRTAMVFAATGLGRLRLEDFRVDLHTLVVDEEILAKAGIGCVEMLRSLPNEDAKWIEAQLTAVGKGYLARWIRTLRSRRDEAADRLLVQSLEEIWHEGLCEDVSRLLRGIFTQALAQTKQNEKERR